MLSVVIACNQRPYRLTIFVSTSDGKLAERVHTITGATDSIAYARGATVFLLSLHAYKMMMDNAKPFISKPTGFTLIDGSGKNVDSLLGKEKADAIVKELASLIN